MRYVFFVIFELLYLLPVFTKGDYLWILWAALLGWTFYLVNSIEKLSTQDGDLTGSQKIQIIITEIFNPLIAGAFYYYSWKKKLPIKAKQANKYSLIIFGVSLIFVAIYLIMMGTTTYNGIKNRAAEAKQSQLK